LILVWETDHVPTLQPLGHASAEGIHGIELDSGRACRLWRHLRLRGPGERSRLTGMSLASYNCSPQLAEELIDFGPQEHGHQGHQDWHQAHQFPKAKLNDKDEDACEEEEENQEEMEEKPVNQEPPSALQDTPNQKEVCQEAKGSTYDGTNNLTGVGDAPETLLLCGFSSGVGEVVAKVGAQCWHLNDGIGNEARYGKSGPDEADGKDARPEWKAETGRGAARVTPLLLGRQA